MGNAGVIPPVHAFLKELRDITAEENSILIFDEVITGFRVSLGGAQELYGIKPDLTCLGKIIGGGMPVGAFGGKRKIMEYLAPVGPIYQAGTLSGNPLAMAAGYETVSILKQKGVYEKLEETSGKLEEGIKENLKKLNLSFTSNRVGSMMSLFFTDTEVSGYRSASASNTELFSSYFKEMLLRGINIAPSQFEASFVSTAHTNEDIEKTIKANYESLKRLL